MKKLPKEIEFLNKLSNLLSLKLSPLKSIGDINNLFIKYLGIKEIEFIIYGKNGVLLKDFIQNWKILDEIEKNKDILNKYSNLVSLNGEKIYFNNILINVEITSDDESIIQKNILEKNIIYIPIVSNEEVFGILRVVSEEKKYERSFFTLLNITSRMASGAFISYVLSEQMDVTLNFYKAMKDIAKIIESQYELSYIIPLIGEMIDRFMPSHLIYIFLKEKKKFKLVWPSACKDEKINDLLKKLTNKPDCKLSDNESIGACPIIFENKVIGAIVAYSNIDKLSQLDIEYLTQLTNQSSVTIQRANMYAEVLKYATMDALTGLNNRRQMEIRLKQEVSNSKRNNNPLCCMMLDVDYFKKVNDTYGHSAGDIVLKKISEAIKTEIREYDIACRYGGEEFLIILPQTNSKEAILVAQRLRKVIESTQVNIKEAGIDNVKFIKISVSIGVCSFDNSMNADSFIQKADKALYEAKTLGRNRVIFH